jgi:hypothetical protein
MAVLDRHKVRVRIVTPGMHPVGHAPAVRQFCGSRVSASVL